MGINAVALLHLPDLQLHAGSSQRVQRLDDAVLLHMGVAFGAEPEELAQQVRAMVGDALDQHEEERGIFFIPDVAAPQARTYNAVIAEVGEGGMWGNLPEDSLDACFAGGQGLETALGSMLGQLPGGLLDSLTQAAMRGDMAALQQQSMGLESIMQANPQLTKLASDLEKKVQMPDLQSPALAAMLGGGGVDIDSPAFAQLMSQVQAQLASDPSLLMSLAEQFFGGAQASAGSETSDTADNEEESDPKQRG